MPHTDFPKVTWVTFVKVDPVMTQATSITTHTHTPCACRCGRDHGSHGPKVFGSSSVWMACWSCKSQALCFLGFFSLFWGDSCHFDCPHVEIKHKCAFTNLDVFSDISTLFQLPPGCFYNTFFKSIFSAPWSSRPQFSAKESPSILLHWPGTQA